MQKVEVHRISLVSTRCKEGGEIRIRGRRRKCHLSGGRHELSVFEGERATLAEN